MAIFQPVLQLGDFTFDTFEQPTDVPFGKEQSAYKHVLIGGGRVIDLLGAGDPDITWSGYFTGAQAEDRARYLETLAKAGQALTLKTSQYVKQVVITTFTYGFHFVFPIQYTISLMVIQDQTLPVTFAVPGDLTATILQALIEAADIATLIANPSVESAIALALIAAQEASPFGGTTSTAVNAALAGAQNAQSVIQATITANETGLFGSPTATATVRGVIEAFRLPNFEAQSIELSQLALLYELQSLMNAYVIKNILLTYASPQAQLITFMNPNLYQVAASHYGDAQLWSAIANANNLSDPFYSEGAITLLIPPQPTQTTGGVLNPPT